MRSGWLKIFAALVFFVACSAASLPTAAAAAPPWETGQSEPEDLKIKVVIFSPGDEIVSWFGHIAMVVEDSRLDVRRMYNYGMFSFDSKMLLKFAMGRLWFWVGEAPVYRTYEYYKRQNRSVRIMELNLGAAERQQIATALAVNVHPENRDYLYHHYFDNCSTRIRDLIDQAIDGQLHAATDAVTGKTLRDHTRRHSARSPAVEMLLMFLMNNDIDQPITRWDEMFLPGEVEKVIRDLRYVNKKGETVALVADEVVYFEPAGLAPTPEEPPTRWPGALGLGALLGGIAVGLGRRYFRSLDAPSDGARPRRRWRVLFGLYHAAIGMIIGIPGLALAVMWMVTDHTVTYHSETLFLGNPLTFLLIPLGIALALGAASARRWLRPLWLVLAGLGLLLLPLSLLPAFDQNIWLPVAFILPILLGFGFVWWRHGGADAASENDARVGSRG